MSNRRLFPELHGDKPLEFRPVKTYVRVRSDGTAIEASALCPEHYGKATQIYLSTLIGPGSWTHTAYGIDCVVCLAWEKREPGPDEVSLISLPWVLYWRREAGGKHLWSIFRTEALALDWLYDFGSDWADATITYERPRAATPRK